MIRTEFRVQCLEVRRVGWRAAARREVFVDLRVRRNRVWQADFSTFETTSEGTWRLCGVVDYATKIALACPVTTTQDRLGVPRHHHPRRHRPPRRTPSGDRDRRDAPRLSPRRGLRRSRHRQDRPPRGCDRQRPRHEIRRRGPLVRRAEPPHPRAHPPPRPAHQRRRRTLVRVAEIRTPLPPRHRQRHRPLRPRRRLHQHLQHHPPPTSPRPETAPRRLPRSPNTPTEPAEH